MNDDRLVSRINEWLLTLDKPCAVELRCKDEIIEAIELTEESGSDFGQELLDAATDDSSSEGKTRVYTLVAITSESQRYECPLRIRRKVERGQVELYSNMGKMIVELHETLRKDRKDTFGMMTEFIKRLEANNASQMAAQEKYEQRARETIDLLETLRSKVQERELAKDKHDKELDMKERAVGILLPLASAIGSKFTKGALPAPKTIEEVQLISIAQSLEENQIDALANAADSLWPMLKDIITKALDGQADVSGFKNIVNSMTDEQRIGVAQCLNMGQLAALKELLTAS